MLPQLSQQNVVVVALLEESLVGLCTLPQDQCEFDVNFVYATAAAQHDRVAYEGNICTSA